jgi:hypothetical protein
VDAANTFANITNTLSFDKKREIISNATFINLFKNLFSAVVYFLKNISKTIISLTSSSSYHYEYDFLKPYSRILVNLLNLDEPKVNDDVLLLLYFIF